MRARFILMSRRLVVGDKGQDIVVGEQNCVVSVWVRVEGGKAEQRQGGRNRGES